jgi:hypothetical protein
MDVKLKFILPPKFIAYSNNKFQWNSLSIYGDETYWLKDTASLWRVKCTRLLHSKYADIRRCYAARFSFATQCTVAADEFVILRLREFIYTAEVRFD